MPLIHFEIDDSFYPISRRKLFKVFGLVVWSKSYVLTHIGGLDFAWSDESGNFLEVSK